MGMSQETAAEYVVKPAACVPQFDMPAGTYVEGFIVTISCPVTHNGVPGSKC
jgi:hypothetical protein